MNEQFLSGTAVFEASDHPAVAMAGKILAEVGASVTKVRAPGEAPPHHGSRHAEPFYNSAKHIVEVPCEAWGNLAGNSDVVIHGLLWPDAAALGLDFATLSAASPQLIVCAVTPFGQDGPWTNYRASDLTAFAVSGMMHLCGYDDWDHPPVVAGGPQAANVAATFAVNSILIALFARLSSGVGQFLDVSIHESGADSLDMANAYKFYPGATVHRQTSRGAAPTRTQRVTFQGSDGRWLQVHLAISDQHAWPRFVAWLEHYGFAVDLGDAAYADPAHRRASAGHIYGILEAFVGAHDAYDLFRTAQEHGVPAGIIYAPDELPDDPHLRERGMFIVEEGAAGSGGSLRLRSPYRVRGAPQRAENSS